MRDQAERCAGCGTRRRDWEADHFAFVGHISRCPGCEVIAMEQENVESAAKMGADTKGLRIGLVSQEQADRLGSAGVDALGA